MNRKAVVGLEMDEDVLWLNCDWMVMGLMKHPRLDHGVLNE
jgi:hypothetical protein